ncbi:hypothetical protein SD457_21215 [Coprobacillaceae bacterium CR2/5/TPMF4]|nr:hypothetical protein SD457_21215 [Coprobacillaceae bacterium CR2/5/TPMF4]
MRYNQEKEVRRQESDSEYLIDFLRKSIIKNLKPCSSELLG